MNENHRKIEAVYNELTGYPNSMKKIFLETLLFNFTITGRAIHSDETQSDKVKLDALNWLNELVHRVWNIHSVLNEEKNEDVTLRLYENMKFYADMSSLLNSHLIPTFLLTYAAVKNRIEEQC